MKTTCEYCKKKIELDDVEHLDNCKVFLKKTKKKKNIFIDDEAIAEEEEEKEASETAADIEDEIDVDEVLSSLFEEKDFSKDKNYMQCTGCDKYFTKGKEFWGHFHVCKCSSDKYQKCVKCGKHIHKKYYTRHLNKYHKDVLKDEDIPEGYKLCGQCKWILSKNQYGHHINTKHGGKRKQGKGDPGGGRKKDKKKRKAKGNAFFCTFHNSIKHSVAALFDRYKKKPRAIVHWVYKLNGRFRIHRQTGDRILLMFPAIRPKVKYVQRKHKQLVKGYVVSNEMGVLREHAHSHCVMECNGKKTDLDKLRKFIKKHFRCLGDIQSCGSVKSSIKYCTKEDIKALVRDIDRELLHPDWQMYQIATLAPTWDIALDNCAYQVRKWGNQFQLNKFRRIYDQVQQERYRVERLSGAEKHYNRNILKLLSPSKKGIWLYGKPGTGKTSTVLKYTSGKHFEMPKSNNQFIFNCWTYDQDVLVFEDEEKTKMITISRLINTLTDDNGLHMGERKGGAHFPIRIRKCIITSNDSPPTEEEWPGFRRRFDVIHAI